MARVPSKRAMTEPHLLPSPPPSPTPSDTPTERDPDNINKAYLTLDVSTTNKGKQRMVDSPIEYTMSDQDDGSDELLPDEAETKRIEEVRVYLQFWFRRTHPRSLDT